MSEIKQALITRLDASTSEDEREFWREGYLALADFLPGVGPNGIDLNSDKQSIQWLNRSKNELNQLKAELHRIAPQLSVTWHQSPQVNKNSAAVMHGANGKGDNYQKDPVSKLKPAGRRALLILMLSTVPMMWVGLAWYLNSSDESNEEREASRQFSEKIHAEVDLPSRQIDALRDQRDFYRGAPGPSSPARQEKVAEFDEQIVRLEREREGLLARLGGPRIR
jgi:hypothetical protein